MTEEPQRAKGRALWRYVPWAVLVSGLAVTITTWRTMASHERVEIGWATQMAADAIKTDLVEDMEWQRIGLDRLALLWAASNPTERLWTQNAELYIEHRPGCVAVEWLAREGNKRAVVMPVRTNPILAFDGYPKAAIESAKKSRATTLSTTATLPGEAHNTLSHSPSTTPVASFSDSSLPSLKSAAPFVRI